MHILLAMPRESERRECRKILEKLGNTVEEVANAQDAFRVSDHKKINLLIISREFKKKDAMDGLKLIGHIRFRDGYKGESRLPVVLIGHKSRKKKLYGRNEPDLTIEAPFRRADWEIISRLFVGGRD